MAIAANTSVRPEKMSAWMKPTSNSSPYTPPVATKGTKKADTKTRISPAVMFPNSLKVKLISLTNSLNASNGPTKKKSRRPNLKQGKGRWKLKGLQKKKFKELNV